jgi:hypothetical protein
MSIKPIEYVDTSLGFAHLHGQTVVSERKLPKQSATGFLRVSQFNKYIFTRTMLQATYRPLQGPYFWTAEITCPKKAIFLIPLSKRFFFTVVNFWNGPNMLCSVTCDSLSYGHVPSRRLLNAVVDVTHPVCLVDGFLFSTTTFLPPSHTKG